MNKQIKEEMLPLGRRSLSVDCLVKKKISGQWFWIWGRDKAIWEWGIFPSPPTLPLYWSPISAAFILVRDGSQGYLSKQWTVLLDPRHEMYTGKGGS